MYESKNHSCTIHLPSTHSTICFTRWFALNSSPPTMTLTTSEAKKVSASALMASGQVALNITVCLISPDGHDDRIFRIAGSKPSSSILSASSKTKYFMFPRVKAFSSNRSINLPGVAIVIHKIKKYKRLSEKTNQRLTICVYMYR